MWLAGCMRKKKWEREREVSGAEAPTACAHCQPLAAAPSSVAVPSLSSLRPRLFSSSPLHPSIAHRLQPCHCLLPCHPFQLLFFFFSPPLLSFPLFFFPSLFLSRSESRSIEKKKCKKGQMAHFKVFLPLIVWGCHTVICSHIFFPKVGWWYKQGEKKARRTLFIRKSGPQLNPFDSWVPFHFFYLILNT